MIARLITRMVACVALCTSGADNFEFVVIGDTRPRFESENFHVFESLIPRINALKPVLVVNLGDLIYGYGWLKKETQWNKYQQVIKAFEAPYYQLPGNHDTFSKEARKVYGQRFGKFYQSFNHGNCHFVLLDNTEEGGWGNLGSAELEWLKSDLQAAQGRPVFVFLHFPVWEPERVAPKYYQFWAKTLHLLFKQYGVRAVFGGHFHSYGPTREFDGIRYFITGGGGAELKPVYQNAGGAHHFLRVKISGDKFDVRIVTTQGELTDAQADVLGGLEFGDKHSSRIGINPKRQDLRQGVEVSISLSNPYREPMSGSAEWTYDASAFAVQPEKITIRIAPGATRKFAFTLKTLADTVLLQSLPRLEFNVISDEWHHRFQRSVHFVQALEARQPSSPPTIDGRLEDWGDVRLLCLQERAKPDAQVGAVHDGTTLFLAITVPATHAQTNEPAVFPDDLQIGFAVQSQNQNFGRDVLRLGFARAGNLVEITDRTPGAKGRSTAAAVRCISKRETAETTFEMAIPFQLFRPAKIKSGSRLVANLAFPLPAEDVNQREPDDPMPNSLPYQVRYGGGSLVPVHFIELQLGNKQSTKK